MSLDYVDLPIQRNVIISEDTYTKLDENHQKMQWVQYLKTKQNKQKTPEKLFKVSHQKQNIKIKNTC